MSKYDEFRGFVRYVLTEHEKAQIRACSSDPADLTLLIEELVSDDLKLEIKRDPFGDGSQCTLYGLERSRNYRKGLSGRGSTPYTAVRQAWWMHKHLFEGEWPDPNQPMKLQYED